MKTAPFHTVSQRNTSNSLSLMRPGSTFPQTQHLSPLIQTRLDDFTTKHWDQNTWESVNNRWGHILDYISLIIHIMSQKAGRCGNAVSHMKRLEVEKHDAAMTSYLGKKVHIHVCCKPRLIESKSLHLNRKWALVSVRHDEELTDKCEQCGLNLDEC